MAHLALAQAAAVQLDAVVLVLPSVLPHKSFNSVSFTDRAHMLRKAVAGHAGLFSAVSEGGLFLEIAGECRALYGRDVELTFVCGRDAAARIVEWDYGDPAAIGRLLRQFRLLVASRDGAYAPPAHLTQSIGCFRLPPEAEAISATEVRRRIREGGDWEHLVPAAIVPLVREIYGRAE